MQLDDRLELIDTGEDVLSHAGRRDQIHLLSVDPILMEDIGERLAQDARLKPFRLIRPHAADMKTAVEEIEGMAQETILSRLLIFDVRRATLPRLRKAFNAIVGYNRKNINKLCFTLLIGDGPPNLFQNGWDLDVFVPFLTSHRTDFYPAVFFYDPLLHYEPDEIELKAIDEEFTLLDRVPRRLVPYLRQGHDVEVRKMRRFLRATGKDEQTRRHREQIILDVYSKQMAERSRGHESQLKAWTSQAGLQLATERLNLYPLFFEDWVAELMEKARQNATP